MSSKIPTKYLLLGCLEVPEYFKIQTPRAYPVKNNNNNSNNSYNQPCSSSYSTRLHSTHCFKPKNCRFTPVPHSTLPERFSRYSDTLLPPDFKPSPVLLRRLLNGLCPLSTLFVIISPPSCHSALPNTQQPRFLLFHGPRGLHRILPRTSSPTVSHTHLRAPTSPLRKCVTLNKHKAPLPSCAFFYTQVSFLTSSSDIRKQSWLLYHIASSGWPLESHRPGIQPKLCGLPAM